MFVEQSEQLTKENTKIYFIAELKDPLLVSSAWTVTLVLLALQWIQINPDFLVLRETKLCYLLTTINKIAVNFMWYN